MKESCLRSLDGCPSECLLSLNSFTLLTKVGSSPVARHFLYRHEAHFVRLSTFIGQATALSQGANLQFARTILRKKALQEKQMKTAPKW